MREVRFRIWNTSQEFMDEVDTLDLEAWNDENERPTNIRLMQYTGLKDKNGVEIYEGDVLFIGETEEVVVWREDLAGFAPFVQQIPDAADLYSTWEYLDNGKILGNIYENPELLEKTHES